MQNSRNENPSFPAFVGKIAIRSAKRYILVCSKNNQNNIFEINWITKLLSALTSTAGRFGVDWSIGRQKFARNLHLSNKRVAKPNQQRNYSACSRAWSWHSNQKLNIKILLRLHWKLFMFLWFSIKIKSDSSTILRVH